MMTETDSPTRSGGTDDFGAFRTTLGSRRRAAGARLVILIGVLVGLVGFGAAHPRSALAQSWTDDARATFEVFGDVLRGGNGAGGSVGLTVARIVDALKQGLEVATERAVDRVGVRNGYFKNPDIHIPLPDSLQRVRSVLDRVGLGSLGDTLEERLNRAAELAAPEAQAVFFQAIGEMTVRDAEGILKGPDDAATQFFRRTMSAPLKQRLRPIVEEAVVESRAVQAYDAMIGSYREALPFLPDIRADLTGYTVDKGLEGLFFVLAREEARIRRDPAARTTDLLRQVFGG